VNKVSADRNPCGGVWFYSLSRSTLEARMDGIIYLVGLIVIVMAILSFFGLR
jgi:hypothetical protein